MTKHLADMQAKPSISQAPILSNCSVIYILMNKYHNEPPASLMETYFPLYDDGLMFESSIIFYEALGFHLTVNLDIIFFKSYSGVFHNDDFNFFP
jgi:hypothetical protein